MQQAPDVLVKVGFEIQYEEDLGERNDDVPWNYPLEGDVTEAQTFRDIFTCWRTSTSGKFVTHHDLAMSESLRLVPKGTWGIRETLKIVEDSIIKIKTSKIKVNSIQR
jgi:sterol 24-C-methyltransferase